jgi:hypothetical protein
VPDAPLFHAPAGTDQTSGTWMAAVAADNGGPVAVGTVGTQLGTGPGLAWHSADGRTWSSADGTSWACIASDPGFTDFAAASAAGSATIEVVVGVAASVAPDAIVWIRPVP